MLLFGIQLEIWQAPHMLTNFISINYEEPSVFYDDVDIHVF